MIEYKVSEAKNADEAERVMNEMAAQGWTVVSTSFWQKWKTCILITFSRER